MTAAAQTGAGNVTKYATLSNVLTVVVPKPANLVNGDVLICAPYQVQASGTPAWSVPSGWVRASPLYAVSTGSRRPFGLWYKIITDAASEPSTYTFTIGGTGVASGRANGIATILKGVDLVTPVNIASAWGPTATLDSGTSITQTTIPSITTTADNCLIIAGVYTQTGAGAGAQYGNPTATGVSGMTLIDRADAAPGTTVASSQVSLYQQLQSTAGVVAAKTFTITASSGPNGPGSANHTGFMVAFNSAGTPPAEPVATDMECIVHRGIEASAQAVTAEESVPGLVALLAKYPWINGVEVDARISSDGVVYLFHDATLAERHYPGATGSVESNTSTYLDGLGLTRLSTYLASDAAAKLKTIFVQFYVAWVPLTKATIVVNVIKASVVRSRVIVGVTGTENGYIDELRTIWDGRIGLYGFDTSNVSSYKTALEASGGYMGFIVPYDANYSANRSVVATLHADGVKVGGSVLDTAPVMTMLEGDGADYVLTNEPGVYEDLFIAPANPSSKVIYVKPDGTELEFLGIWNGTSCDPAELIN